MNILIVDDQPDVVKGIVAGVDWDQVLVSNVFTANSMAEAQAVFARQRVEIVVSDIEMPLGSGLELVAWVREHHPATECIFLTSHEDFAYARAALQLGSLDYLLQPIKYDELERAIIGAISKVRLKSEADAYYTYGKYWEQNTARLRESFWLQILSGRYLQNKARLDMIAGQLGLTPEKPSEYLLTLINIQRRQIELSEWDDDLLKHTFINLLEELIFNRTDVLQLVQMDSGHFAVLIPSGDDERIEKRQLVQRLQVFTGFCARHMNCSLSCYVGNYVGAEALPEAYRQLIELEKSNVARYNKVFLLGDSSSPGESAAFAGEIACWEKLLGDGEYNRVANEACGYITRAVESGIVDSAYLAGFQKAFLDAVWRTAHERGVRLQDVLTDKTVNDLYLNSLNSIESFFSFIRRAAQIPGGQKMSDEDYLSAVEQAKLFIRDNLDRELSRNEIADKVYLSPEYLSRLFRKHTGETLSDYITVERIRLAREYLTNTRMPVSIIASRIGYANFSHFSKVFKKITGHSPVEYRQLKQSD